MAPVSLSAIQRRDFLKLAGATTAFSLTHRALAGPSRRIAVVVDCEDPIASSDPVKWAAGRLRNALVAKGAICEIVQSPDQVSGSSFSVLATGAGSGLVKGFPKANGELTGPESLRLTPGRLAETPAIWVSAIDQRGFVYGLLELAERVQFNSGLADGLHLTGMLEEKPGERSAKRRTIFLQRD